jgi:hypothetical protein
LCCIRFLKTSSHSPAAAGCCQPNALHRGRHPAGGIARQNVSPMSQSASRRVGGRGNRRRGLRPPCTAVQNVTIPRIATAQRRSNPSTRLAKRPSSHNASTTTAVLSLLQIRRTLDTAAIAPHSVMKNNATNYLSAHSVTICHAIVLTLEECLIQSLR